MSYNFNGFGLSKNNTIDTGLISRWIASDNPVPVRSLRTDMSFLSVINDGGGRPMLIGSTLDDRSSDISPGDSIFVAFNTGYESGIYTVHSISYSTNTRIALDGLAFSVNAQGSCAFLNLEYRGELVVTNDNTSEVIGTLLGFPALISPGDHLGGDGPYMGVYFDIGNLLSPLVKHDIQELDDDYRDAAVDSGMVIPVTMTTQGKFNATSATTSTLFNVNSGATFYIMKASRQHGINSGPYGQNMGDYLPFDDPQLLASITSIDSNSGKVRLLIDSALSDRTSYFNKNDMIYVDFASTYTDGVYKVIAADFDGTNTRVTLDLTYSASTTGNTFPWCPGAFLTEFKKPTYFYYRADYSCTIVEDIATGGIICRISGNITDLLESGMSVYVEGGGTYPLTLDTIDSFQFDASTGITDIYINSISYVSTLIGATIGIMPGWDYYDLSYIHQEDVSGNLELLEFYFDGNMNHTRTVTTTLTNSTLAGVNRVRMRPPAMGERYMMPFLRAATSGRILTRPLTIKLRNVMENGESLGNAVHFRWPNRLGGFDYFTFGVNQRREVSMEDRQIIDHGNRFDFNRESFASNDTVNYFSELQAKGYRTMSVYAHNIDADEIEVLQSAPMSRMILMDMTRENNKQMAVRASLRGSEFLADVVSQDLELIIEDIQYNNLRF